MFRIMVELQGGAVLQRVVQTSWRAPLSSIGLTGSCSVQRPRFVVVAFRADVQLRCAARRPAE